MINTGRIIGIIIRIYVFIVPIPSTLAALHISSSIPRKPAKSITIIKPVPCHNPDISSPNITVSGSFKGSKEKLSQPKSRITPCNPKSGFKIHCQVNPVTMNDKANGYNNIVRNVFSNRIFRSSKAAKVNPIKSVKINEKIPYSAKFSIDIIHLRVSHKRSY